MSLCVLLCVGGPLEINALIIHRLLWFTSRKNEWSQNILAQLVTLKTGPVYREIKRLSSYLLNQRLNRKWNQKRLIENRLRKCPISSFENLAHRYPEIERERRRKIIISHRLLNGRVVPQPVIQDRLSLKRKSTAAVLRGLPSKNANLAWRDRLRANARHSKALFLRYLSCVQILFVSRRTFSGEKGIFSIPLEKSQIMGKLLMKIFSCTLSLITKTFLGVLDDTLDYTFRTA